MRLVVTVSIYVEDGDRVKVSVSVSDACGTDGEVEDAEGVLDVADADWVSKFVTGELERVVEDESLPVSKKTLRRATEFVV